MADFADKTERKPRKPMHLPDYARIVAGNPHEGNQDEPCPGPVDCREWTPEDDEAKAWSRICYVNPWVPQQAATVWVHREFLRRASQRRYQTLTEPAALNVPARRPVFSNDRKDTQ